MTTRLILVFVLFGPLSVLAHDPDNLPTAEEVEGMSERGTLDDSLLRLKWIAEHKLDEGVNATAYYRLKRDQLVASGKTETEIATALYGDGPLAAFPFAGIRPELDSSGVRKTLTILIDFKDKTHEEQLPGITPEVVRLSVYGDATDQRTALYAPFESVKAYYDRASEGKFTLAGNVLGWYTFPENRNQYEPAEVTETSGMTANQVEIAKFINNQKALYRLATTALDQFDEDGHDFAQYDNDNDGDIDNLTILYAGPRGEWASFWWAYQWSFQLSSFDKTYDGKSLNQFVFQFVDTRGPGGADFNPRTLVHEMGHALGLPDYYDYDGHLPKSRRKGPDGGIGGLDIMDANLGNHNAFSRWLLDWVEPAIISAGSPEFQTVTASSETGSGSKALALFPGLDPAATAPGGDMFLLEYRKKSGNDRNLPNSGLLLWRVDGTPNASDTGFEFNNSDTNKKLIRLVRSGSAKDFEAQERATAADFFKSGDEFTPFSSPGSGTTRLSITDIHLDGADAKVKVGYLSPAEFQILQARRVEDSKFLEALKGLIATSKPQTIRLAEIETINDEINDATSDELAVAWQFFQSEDAQNLKTREQQIVCQNVLVGWSSKDGLAAAQAAISLEKRLLDGPQGTENVRRPLYEKIMANWATAKPDQALAWATRDAADLPDPGKEFSETVIANLAKTDPNAVAKYAGAHVDETKLPKSTVYAAQRYAAQDDEIFAAPHDDSGINVRFPVGPEHAPHADPPTPDVWHHLPNGPQTAIPQNGNTHGHGHIAPRPAFPRHRLGEGFEAIDGPGALNVMGYNLESGDADIEELADEVEAFHGVDIWGFSEVADESWAYILENAAGEGEGAEFEQILGTTGGSDRLLIVYNSEELEYVDDFELHRINPRVEGRRRVRSALVARLKYKATGQEFMFMVNHLYRGRADRRHKQAELLNDWVADQEQPVIAVGDYNFDWEVVGGDDDHDLGYDNMTKNDEFEWIRPETLVKTQKSPAYDSVLDFVFASKRASPLAVSSTIIVRDGDTPDTELISDHRPLGATFRFRTTFVGPNPQVVSKHLSQPMKWEEVAPQNLEGLSNAQLQQIVRGLRNQVQETERLHAGQD